MGANAKPLSAYWNRRGLAYLLAVILPIVSSLVTVHVHWLRAFPLTLHFLSLFVVAALGGFWPALIACFTTLGSRGYFEHIGYDPDTLSFADKFRSAFLLLCTIIIAAAFERRMGSERKVSQAHRELEDRHRQPHRDPQQHQVRLLDHRPRQRPERPLVSRQL